MAAVDASLLATARAHLDQVSGGKAPYNAMAGGSVGPGGSGKTQTHRSVMGKPFVEGANRISTVGADRMVLEVHQTKTGILDLKLAETTSLMERAVHAAAKKKTATIHTSIEKLVATDAGRAEVRGATACQYWLTAGARSNRWRTCCMTTRWTCDCSNVAPQGPRQPRQLVMAVSDDTKPVRLAPNQHSSMG